MNGACTTPLTSEALAAHALGELAPEEAERVEEHFFACAECTRRLEAVQRLATAVETLVREGRVQAAVSPEWLREAEAGGLVVRAYRLAPGETVACTAGPDDHLIVLRFELPELEGAEGIDLRAELVDVRTGERREVVVTDIPVRRAPGELLYAYSAAEIRSLPRTRVTLRASAHGARGDQPIASYTLDHTPWDELAPGTG
ncbi:MAG TPA: zf-HC2 domain-containing protein [Polyangiaceae bacterium]|nr:zf-HC2 domain-containing protein [Polyangiaceae bacterium]